MSAYVAKPYIVLIELEIVKHTKMPLTNGWNNPRGINLCSSYSNATCIICINDLCDTANFTKDSCKYGIEQISPHYLRQIYGYFLFVKLLSKKGKLHMQHYLTGCDANLGLYGKGKCLGS